MEGNGGKKWETVKFRPAFSEAGLVQAVLGGRKVDALRIDVGILPKPFSYDLACLSPILLSPNANTISRSDRLNCTVNERPFRSHGKICVFVIRTSNTVNF